MFRFPVLGTSNGCAELVAALLVFHVLFVFHCERVLPP